MSILISFVGSALTPQQFDSLRKFNAHIIPENMVGSHRNGGAIEGTLQVCAAIHTDEPDWHIKVRQYELAIQAYDPRYQP